jgi:hypothetical protein
MAQVRVPLVLLPRFTTLAGAQAFYSLAIDITAYQQLDLTLWRGPLLGTSPTFAAFVYESLDREHWFEASGLQGVDPGTATETAYVWVLTRRWLHFRVELTGTSPVATCWAAGFLSKRER